MKNIFTIFCFALLGVVGLSSCSDKDEGPVKPGEGIVDSGWREEGNKLIWETTYDYGYGVSYSAEWSLTFDGDSCTDSKCACTFASSELATAFYQSWEDSDYSATKSGNTVTVDYTSLHRGMSKTQLKAAIEAMNNQ